MKWSRQSYVIKTKRSTLDSLLKLFMHHYFSKGPEISIDAGVTNIKKEGQRLFTGNILKNPRRDHQVKACNSWLSPLLPMSVQYIHVYIYVCMYGGVVYKERAGRFLPYHLARPLYDLYSFPLVLIAEWASTRLHTQTSSFRRASHHYAQQ